MWVRHTTACKLSEIWHLTAEFFRHRGCHRFFQVSMVVRSTQPVLRVLRNGGMLPDRILERAPCSKHVSGAGMRHLQLPSPHRASLLSREHHQYLQCFAFIPYGSCTLPPVKSNYKLHKATTTLATRKNDGNSFQEYLDRRWPGYAFNGGNGCDIYCAFSYARAGFALELLPYLTCANTMGVAF